MKEFRLKLQVADMGGMGLTSEGVAIIHVSDINNHAPQFSPDSVSLRSLRKILSVILGSNLSLQFVIMIGDFFSVCGACSTT